MVRSATIVGLACLASLAGAQIEHLPRHLTDRELDIIAEQPLTPERATDVPTGPLWCPPEYAPAGAIIISWEGYNSWKDILAEMAGHFTTTGDADVWVMIDSNGQISGAEAKLGAFGADLSRVRFFVKGVNTIWVRDYGPRFVYEGGVRVIVDHTYNRPRPQDNGVPDHLAGLLGFAEYDLPLVHGGGNFHLSGLGDAHATELILNENAGLTADEVVDLWAQYQGLLTTLHTPFRPHIDSTQHIDMWMIPIADRAVIISDWPLAPGSYEDVVCDDAATLMEGMGYTVHRVPAVHTGGTHYTFTNAVICNDVVCVPSYTNSVARQYNAPSLDVWRQAMPDKTVVQVPAQAIVTAAGVLHCIVKHVPAPAGGQDPTVFLRSLNEPATLEPGEQVELEWITDDDIDTYYLRFELSLDGGATWPVDIDTFELDDGSFTWTVPDVYTTRGRVRAIVFDIENRTGEDINDADITINGSGGCIADFNGDGEVNTLDVLEFLNAWASGDPSADVNDDGTVDTLDVLAFLNAWNTGC